VKYFSLVIFLAEIEITSGKNLFDHSFYGFGDAAGSLGTKWQKIFVWNWRHCSLADLSSVKNGRPPVRGKGKIYGKKLRFCTFNQIFFLKIKGDKVYCDYADSVFF
jgi:hypothetical protein